MNVTPNATCSRIRAVRLGAFLLTTSGIPDRNCLLAFRVLVGGRQRVESARLRDALDALLRNRLPDVKIITVGGSGVLVLTAGYARSHGLNIVAIPIDHIRRGNTVEQRDIRLVELADAPVLVGEATEVRDLLERAVAKGLSVVIVGSVG